MTDAPSFTEKQREAAARDLCRYHGHPENAKFEGKPMWVSYIDEVDVVLKAVREGTAWKQE